MLNTFTDVLFGAALTDELLDQEIQTPENITLNLTFEIPLSFERCATAARTALEQEGYQANFMKNRQIMFSDYTSCDGRPEYIVMSLDALQDARTKVKLTAGFTESGPECDLRLQYMAGLIRIQALE